ncbi:MAG: aminotransferase class V-fold PLP-dependent enzyme [Methylomonas sp.]|jgi:dTDP-4-amino-4,6-dideoxygalactose transaminase|uniref:aminotransferase class V-fold PLP-dependent enzyme n=1 Tax=Methylomonas sp. TaxID=418 RepID=UPI0025E1441A|nr:aminotransferase class V-fold PLP-dependent enzyme [Methylomonas sp.]MCK9606066.1 aminotransferase class V-fold PLP-dependent enzyme [Methylomonas sp.]
MSTPNFPAPSIPPSALLDFVTNKRPVKTDVPSILSIKDARFTTSGRASIALALEHANITTGDEVLIPAYHCEAMVAPARWLGATTIFYKINPDTSIQLEDIDAKITSKTRAIIVTHYFGFEQQLQQIRALCTKHAIVLIEDCAHALFGLSSGQPIGTTGDYAVASCMKFLPIYEGGLICSTSRDISDIKLSSPSLIFQIKSAINCLEAAVFYHRLGLLGRLINASFKLKDKLWAFLKSLKPDRQGIGLGPSSSEGGFGLDEAWIHKTMSIFSDRIVRNAELSYMAEQRRQNYQTLHQSLQTLPGCHPLFPALPDHTVPWVYPLYVSHPEKYFLTLKMQGVPVWRFGEFLDAAVTKDVCPISVEYSKHIFQFPCHQSLTPGEIDWMLNKIKEIFSDKS